MTGLTSVEVEKIARQLEEARTSGNPIDFITSVVDNLTWAEARSIARASDELRRNSGERQIGWKLGWTSEAMRNALGIDRPNWGTLWDSQIAEADVALSDYLHPKIEPELVWRSPVDLPADLVASDVQRTGGEWALGIEVVDPRFPSFNFHALDNTADNSSSAAVRLGGFDQVASSVADLEVTFSNHEHSLVGPGSQAMGSPWEAIAWLARSLAEEDLQIRAGDIIFTGGLTAPFDAAVGTTYSLTCPALDGTTLRFR